MIRLIPAIIIMLYYWLFRIKSYGKLLIFSTGLVPSSRGQDRDFSLNFQVKKSQLIPISNRTTITHLPSNERGGEEVTGCNQPIIRGTSSIIELPKKTVVQKVYGSDACGWVLINLTPNA
jgi:hypothetical protein